ncbi:MAG: sulfurtransferase FdhD [Gammaproteobacteria bacterium]|nr:sulfurtransferase FdhD [Gammaproteobacteria bacterium]
MSKAMLLPELTDHGVMSIHKIDARNQFGLSNQVNVAGELPLTVEVDGVVLVTLMTLGTQPEKLVLGYLRNQTLFDSLDQIKSVSVDWGKNLASVVTLNGDGLKDVDLNNRTVTTGCGQGTVLSCTLDKLYDHRVVKAPIRQSDIYRVLGSIQSFNRAYRAAGSVHGCGLYKDGQVVAFIEDVGRHNAMDTIAGEMWLEDIKGENSFFYTTGRLTSEIVMKAALMGISVLISRNGTTHMGQELAEELGITLISRAKSRQFIAFNAENIIFDEKPE